MAEIEIMDRQHRTTRRPAEMLQTQIEQWQQRRNLEGKGFEWKFTRQDAARELCCHYVP
jgi:hypothetical protein